MGSQHVPSTIDGMTNLDVQLSIDNEIINTGPYLHQYRQLVRKELENQGRTLNEIREVDADFVPPASITAEIENNKHHGLESGRERKGPYASDLPVPGGGRNEAVHLQRWGIFARGTKGPSEREPDDPSLEVRGRIVEWIYVALRCSEIALTPTTLACIALSMTPQPYEFPWSDGRQFVSELNGGTVFGILVSLWSLGFLLWRSVLALKPSLYRKNWALVLEALTTLLTLLALIALLVSFSGLPCEVATSITTACDYETRPIILMGNLFGCYMLSWLLAFAKTIWAWIAGVFSCLGRL